MVLHGLLSSLLILPSCHRSALFVQEVDGRWVGLDIVEFTFLKLSQSAVDYSLVESAVNIRVIYRSVRSS